MPAQRAEGSVDALSVVVPVWNEEGWIRRCVEALLSDGEASGLRLDVVVVDDGSTDRTPAVLDELAAATGIRVIHQANAGRLAARRAGVEAASEPLVLLLDSRVLIRPGALAWLRAQLEQHPERTVWCGHVDTAPGNAYAAFWSGLVKVGWRAYTAQPRTVSFGADEFDRYPKGTGCLVVPRDVLEDAMSTFSSLYGGAAAHLASDDTRMLRDIASQHRIWLSPDFRFWYHGKTGLRGFARQAYFRGTTFVDGYLGHAGPGRVIILAGVTGGLGLALLALRRPATAVAGVAAVVGGVPAVVAAAGGSRHEVLSAATLTPVFLPLFGAGVLRGLALAARRLLRLGLASAVDQ